MIALTACGGSVAANTEIAEAFVAPEPEVITVIETVVVERIVEQAVFVEVTPEPPAEDFNPPAALAPASVATCPEGWPVGQAGWENCPRDGQWNVLYLRVWTTEDIFVYQLAGVNANGIPILEITEDTYSNGDIIVVYDDVNTVSYPFFDFAESVNSEGSTPVIIPGSDPVAYEYVKEFPGRWYEDGEWFYEIAGEYGNGRFVLSDGVFFPECEALILQFPASCNQGTSGLAANQMIITESEE
jgi:hypothetical protein